ncbi:MAG: tRNA (adenosine(37)-N6)-dimethylallyltransferase MiaA [Rikenellaceae bacterium]|jgi:tRNA dimethylallyltransferase|nr:tRNA (adenosine(37)-N6)-dimethylallyltransferase MiaA [Rikenellaceae bacterium]
MSTKPTLIVIVGPTGSGKTDLSIRLARHFGAPILSADSRQVYRGMAIGSAQPTEEQLAVAQHYFVADRAVTDRFTCADFESEALALLDKLFHTQDKVIAVGGSGLYVDALCRGLDELPDADIEIRNTLNARLQSKGLEPLVELLRQLDPAYWARVDRHNPARVVRALEVCLQTGVPYSTFRSGAATERPFDIVKIGVDMERAELYERIDRRVDEMLAAGLEAEARALYPHRNLPSLQTVGYREMFGYFAGEYSLDEAVRLIKRNSRHYAKRQMTWFRRDPSIRWFPPTDLAQIISYIT